jgi:crotonobetainyl-CoA:carnitine CoA-transferase CaiB-like acyl-CoA transferase
VVESARPRALLQLGIDAAAMVEQVPGLTWVSITGYGRAEPGGSWVAFGDDAAVAAGLTIATGATPLFCGDAIADPLTGLLAAVAALESWRAGGGTLVDVALRDVVAHVLGSEAPCGVATVRPCDVPGEWEVVAGNERQRVLPPRARTPTGRARPLGADTERVLRSLAVAC